MNRFVAAVAAALLACGAPGLAGADYLYDAFRDACGGDVNLHYSAADPVIGTVPQEETEIGRIGPNLLVYGGFRYVADGDFRGHLYGIRLFKEHTPNGNDWEFTDTGAANLVTTCGQSGSACLFDAGAMLASRVSAGLQPRKIYTGVPGTPITTTEGAYTLPLTASRALPDSTTGQTDLAGIWSTYASLAPIDAGMPKWRCGSGNCDKIANWTWDCSMLPSGTPASLCPTSNAAGANANNLGKPSSTQLGGMIKWLHGKTRSWPLGDIYHASATVVEPPAYRYKDRFYPEFSEALEDRPAMIYVGANDGMIHAFYASPDLEMRKQGATERWQIGEEAWAYLPVNMLARTLYAVERGAKRFYSQDLSCRFTDVQVDRSYSTSCDTSADRFCGWRTVLLCGQGWGGSWYVALDVTDPLGPWRNADGTASATRTDRYGQFAPMWEFTHLDPTNAALGLGRTWSLPSVSLSFLENPSSGKREPRWLAIFGNGYNSAMKPESGSRKASYRALNLPFDGAYPEHGDGTSDDDGTAYVLDVADGKLLKRFHSSSLDAFVADSTVLDYDDDGLVDSAYLAAYNGMQRINLTARNPSTFAMCALDGMSGGPVLTGHPTAFAYQKPTVAGKHPVFLVAGSGIDSGHDPDQQRNNGNVWGIAAHLFQESPVDTCPDDESYCALDLGFNDGSRKARLLGSPLFSRQAGGDDWLLYTIWTAPHHNKIDQCGGEKSLGNAHLMCMDVTLADDDNDGIVEASDTDGVKTPRCRPCAGFATTDAGYADNVLLYQNISQPPSAPVSADGRIYVTDPTTGIEMTGVNNSDELPPNPNSQPPQSALPPRLISWREVY